MNPYLIVFFGIILFLMQPLIVFSENQIMQEKNPEERYALEEFAELTVDFSWSITPNSMVPVCQWEEIECDNGNNNVRSINLEKKRIKNKPDINIFEPLANLNFLINLNLKNNELSGSILSYLKDLKYLQHVDLSQNQLTGEIPVELFDHPTLNFLFLNDNKLSGINLLASELDVEPVIMTSNLSVLDLGNNQLSGSIPESIGMLANLKVLLLNDNKLSGKIPKSISKLTNLQALYLNGNMLDSEIPRDIILLENLRNSQVEPIENESNTAKKYGLDLRWNALCLPEKNSNKLRKFLDEAQIDGSWIDTQTIPPTNFKSDAHSISSVSLAYSAIEFQDYSGTYELFIQKLLTEHDNCIITDNFANSYSIVINNRGTENITVDNLERDICYCFHIRSATEPHENNFNKVVSKFSNGVKEKPRNDKPDRPKPIDEIRNYTQTQITLKTTPYNDTEGDKHEFTFWEFFKAYSSTRLGYRVHGRYTTCIDHTFSSEYSDYSICYKSDTDLTEFTVTLQPGMQYRWFVGYKNAVNEPSFSYRYKFTVGEMITDRSEEIKIDAGIQPSNYKMYSYSMWLKNPESKKVFNRIKDDNDYMWNYRIATYDPERCDYANKTEASACYVEYGDNLDIEPGRAYWIAARDGLPLTITGVRVSDERFDLPLKFRGQDSEHPEDGRNMIACPMYADFDWGKIQVLKENESGNTQLIGTITRDDGSNNSEVENYVDPRLMKWNGKKYEVITDMPGVYELKKYQGYWACAKQAGVILRFNTGAMRPEFDEKSYLSSFDNTPGYPELDLDNPEGFIPPLPPSLPPALFSNHKSKNYVKHEIKHSFIQMDTVHSNPKLSVEKIPPFGNRIKDLYGITHNIDPLKYKIIVCIYINEWRIKPVLSNPYTYIKPDQSWSCDITTQSKDHLATQIAVFLLPIDFQPLLQKNNKSIFDYFYQNALDVVEIKR